MPLSKKYYQKIAEVLCDTYTDIAFQPDCHEPLDNLTEKLIRYFKADNPRFDRDKFVKAAQCKIRKK